VTIGPHSILVAHGGNRRQHARLGSHVIMGGQAGLADHLEIGDRVMIAAQSGVMRSVSEGQIVAGTPAASTTSRSARTRSFCGCPSCASQLRAADPAGAPVLADPVGTPGQSTPPPEVGPEADRGSAESPARADRPTDSRSTSGWSRTGFTRKK
jgi:hypothetical protein